MAGEEDRLSALSDDLLRRILHFVPFQEAASTSVLSRRWGSLWRSSGAVNLAVRIHNGKGINNDYSKRGDALLSHRDAFVRAAEAAFDAADAPVTRLTLHVEDPGGGGVTDQSTYNFFHLRSHDRNYKEHDVLIRPLLSHPAVARVEEFRVAAGRGAASAPSEEQCYRYRTRYRLRSLPSKALRVLDIAGCSDLTSPATAAFPLLETLRLRDCSVQASDAQALIDAAPRLAAVRLESVFFKGCRSGAAAGAPASVRLRCRAATELVLEFCGMEGQVIFGDRGSIEIDAPRLRYFRYKGSERRFSLASPAPDMAALELHFVQCRYHRKGGRYDEDRTRVLFWQFVGNFAHARALTLRVNRLEDIAVGKARRAELLCTFRNAARLELEGAHHPTSKAAAVAIANLLRCCPAVRDLRLNLSTVPSSAVKDRRYGQPFLRRKDRLDYEKSVGRFMRRGRLNPVISFDYEDKHGDEVADGIPGLSGHSLTCLQSSLRRVGLQFRLDDPSCFGVRLVKFFTGNAKLLEEMCVDSGNRKLCEHMNLDIERWIAPGSSKVCLKRKNLEESSWEFSEIPRKSPNPTTDFIGLATSFTVLPLER